MKNHILFIIDGLPGGGAENVTLTLAKGIALRGYAVTLLSLSDRLDYEIPGEINYIVDRDKGKKGPFRKLCELRRRAASLDSLLPELFRQYGKPTLVISSLHKTDRIVVRSSVLNTCNLWFCVHGMFSRSYLGNKTGFSRWLKTRKIKKVYQNRSIISVSDAVGEDLINNVGLKPSALMTIYNPFHLDDIRARAGQSNPYAHETYIAHVGRFHHVKRHDRLLEAFSLANLPCKLIIVGQGEDAVTRTIQDKVSQLNLQDRVIFTGFTKNPLPIIKGAKMIALSSDSEGLPSVLIEALICHTPVVSTACPGGASEIMTGELQPYLAELTSASLAEKMRKAWDTPPHISEEMYHKFSYDIIIDRYLSLQK
ncbi:glycosyltransferase [Erwinia sorbitola]|uniref:Glycosyltransferase n=1 Tax=Erwinia sorbitola TaxID=2681984 RepID=A0A6I6EXU0_9GAMM|nr:glycosyltransferase [Erwinia sorbitola]MTD28875.1 glycosyltransferase [Erwinia sorbitola]QGU89472.1 glycosyltransferase [Erwinia sorbitola]